MQIARFSYTF